MSEFRSRLSLLAGVALLGAARLPVVGDSLDILNVVSCDDFEVTGTGSSGQWGAAEWLELSPYEEERRNARTKLKLMYSDSGIYALFHCEDRILTSTMINDFDELWREDVVEIFFWPDTSRALYFEYELSPLNKELVLLIPNFEGRQFGWRPWQYEEGRKVVHATAAVGGVTRSGSEVEAWTAEIFIPFSLMDPLLEGVPEKGDRWRGNFYRVDHDRGKRRWSWQKTERSFHEYEKFGVLAFK